ncbi:MAG: 2,3-bisphosphoglycerate-independent phosphoglycerate mutase [Candidatus Margulisiibacteriota bacterium]|nr:MAG: phosphoglycerate mutase (2,3-diphosphoglycerate-independent) [Candidatus Margulisbacteria bacterium GWD2_39_127]OGI02970.1 MAG: phosphoglycerate mutase (2,3-diphosphoglycerate-independent) [Candidatus Margulisbacteria bacterium GWF2_38_17]OGI09437.1 MAG: phosphoglycerate mutase (2,3-diphosphoglycerate-independent) [Candidatus Margulisbacteria bacterium GWE2_39_32]PZM78763.1 MAG: 2,3-bisphosphoglycerate-independent phosphoglycerate mutase [Candidatus Margulisiibacteriota bacterium]HAR633
MILLTILDGWGINKNEEGNACKLANTPNIDSLFETYPNTVLTPSGVHAGLPEGQMGNSEVGHLNLGAGRIVNQSLQQINLSIQDGSFFNNTEFIEAINNAKTNNSSLHLMGLLSDGGVHTNNKHLYALLELAKQEDFTRVYIHCFMDGRDTSPTSGIGFVTELLEEIKRIGVGEIATITGRYYAMDRDNRWDRAEKAYNALVNGKGVLAQDPIAVMQVLYDQNITDEFIDPIVLTKDNSPVATINNHDSVIFFNFRPDRARQLSYIFLDQSFDGFKRTPIHQLHYVCMTEYDKKIIAPVAFKPIRLNNVLAEVLANNNKKQLHIAETEKYAHVTFFFNGGVEKQYQGEERILIPSPKVATYDLQPEMSAYEVTEKVIESIDSRQFDVIILNLANPDMVGHTGIIEAGIKAMETIDICIGKIVEKILYYNEKMILTSDHGNLEYMTDEQTGKPFTAHTTNDVPVIFISNDKTDIRLRDNVILADIAPTILDLLNIEKPIEMTGTSIIC